MTQVLGRYEFFKFRDLVIRFGGGMRLEPLFGRSGLTVGQEKGIPAGVRGKLMNWRVWGAGWLAAGAMAAAGGCASVPPVDNPVLVRPKVSDPPGTAEQPTGRPGCAGYDEVYERALDALDDYFEIIPGSRYAREIRTYPRVAPGYEQPWKPGSPDAGERWTATFQSVRHFAIVRLADADGGYRVTVEVYKELESVGIPLQSLGGPAAFRSAPLADRTSDTLTGPATAERQWAPAGPAPHRDFAFEQAILKKILRPGGVK